MIARRTLVIGAAVAATAALGVPTFRTLRDALSSLPEFTPLADPPGFRSIASGPVSFGTDIFVGLDDPAPQTTRVSAAHLRDKLCDTLFGPVTGDNVAIASFSDYYCPYCRVQTRYLAELAEDHDRSIQVAWHELPLLGRASVVAARAALAAKRQGGYLRFHDRLLATSFQPTPGYLRAVATEVGLDPERLIADMAAEDVQRELEQSAALADLFGLIGTPAMIIGRTVVQGRISDRTLQWIIEDERRSDWAKVC